MAPLKYPRKYPEEFATRRGKAITRLYRTWYDMHKRCKPDARENQSRNYYERGIRVCADWHDWPTFARWAMANGYTDQLTIDRKDGNLGYSPENCRWVSMLENCRNRDPIRVSDAARTSRLRYWARPFMCVETGETFINQQDVVLLKGINASSLSMALSGKYKKSRRTQMEIHKSGGIMTQVVMMQP